MAILRQPWICRTCVALAVLSLPLLAWRLLDAPETAPLSAEHTRMEQVARAALALLMAEGGFTVEPHTGRSAGDLDAWAVSLAGAEERHHSPPSIDALVSFLNRNAHRFTASPNIYFGGWHDRIAGEWVLDVTCLTPDKREAVAIGQANQQRCIFHLRDKEEYWLQPQAVFTSFQVQQ